VRDLLEPEVDRWRLRDARTLALYGAAGDGTCGAFLVRGGGVALLVIASAGLGWDHVSVSTRGRCPTWQEMERVRKLFFAPDEVAVQYGVPEAMHVNFNPHTLHWWRPLDGVFPLPPRWMVGPYPGWRDEAGAG
jgi:hypothetical protein